jgi:hypothetical protein
MKKHVLWWIVWNINLRFHKSRIYKCKNVHYHGIERKGWYKPYSDDNEVVLVDQNQQEELLTIHINKKLKITQWHDRCCCCCCCYCCWVKCTLSLPGSARGWMTRLNGSPNCFNPSLEVGSVYNVERINFGEQLPTETMKKKQKCDRFIHQYSKKFVFCSYWRFEMLEENSLEHHILCFSRVLHLWSNTHLTSY